MSPLAKRPPKKASVVVGLRIPQEDYERSFEAADLVIETYSDFARKAIRHRTDLVMKREERKAARTKAVA